MNTADIIQKEFGDEVLGKYVKNTIKSIGGRNPWAYSGIKGLLWGFTWHKAPEGGVFWHRLYMTLRRRGYSFE